LADQCEKSEKLAIALFSGTLDRLYSATLLASGAAAMGKQVDLFLTFWGLAAFRKGQDKMGFPVSSDYGQEGARLGRQIADKQVPPWFETLAAAREIGDIRIHACPMSMDVMDISKDDLEDVVDDVIGVASFVELAGEGQVLFI
jgi:peroxiredoxin family protein